MVFFFFLFSANLIEEKNSVSEMGRKKYSVITLCLTKYCFCRKKIFSQQKNSATLRSGKYYFDYEKTIAPPPPPLR